MEDTWLKMGGRYTIALVETSTGYDVIYIDGAQVKKSQWHLGMKKGEMTKTQNEIDSLGNNEERKKERAQ